MPVKKKAGTSRSGKSSTGTKTAKKSTAKTKKTAAKKQPIERAKATEKATVEIAPKPTPPPGEPVECSHCEGTGKCGKGQPYDKGHHQGLFADFRLTSCFECLDAAGESRNTKKLVVCRFCLGTGKVSKA